ncbi:hypothetical protein YC2023_023979 [Brassica napus]
MVQPESHQTVQTGHLGGTSDRGSVQGVYLYNQKYFQHETNFIGFYTPEGIQDNWNWVKIFTEQEVMNFTSQRFLSPSICEYPTLEADSSPRKERPEPKPIIGFKRDLSSFQKAQYQEKWPRNYEPVQSASNQILATRRSLQPIRRHHTRPRGVLQVHTMHQQPLDQEDPHLLGLGK